MIRDMEVTVSDQLLTEFVMRHNALDNLDADAFEVVSVEWDCEAQAWEVAICARENFS